MMLDVNGNEVDEAVRGDNGDEGVDDGRTKSEKRGIEDDGATMRECYEGDPVEMNADEHTRWDEGLKTWVRKHPITGIVYYWEEKMKAFMPVVDEGAIEKLIRENYVAKEDEYERRRATGNELKKSDAKPGEPKSLIDMIHEDRYQRDRNLDEIVVDSNGTSYVKKKVNRTIYFQGLPADITVKECVNFFSKAGLIKRDDNGEYMIKLYREEGSGQLKGDGVVTFLRPESVSQSFILLDEVEIRPGYSVKINEAMFKIQGPITKKKRKKKKSINDPIVITKKKKKKFSQSHELSWDEVEQKHVILKRMFRLEDASKDIFFYDKLKEEVMAEALKFGKVESVKIFEGNADGVVAIKFADGIAAEKCLTKMKGRLFDGVRIEAEFYDGYSNYKVAEQEPQQQQRERDWVEWLEQ